MVAPRIALGVKDNQEALYEIAFCYDVLDKQQESIAFYLGAHS